MPVASTTLFNIQRLRRYNGPLWFLGYGAVAGLLLFVLWYAHLPSHGREAVHAAGNGVVGAGAPAAQGDGVLGGITGELRAGAASDEGGDSSFFDSEADADAAAAAQDENAQAGADPDAGLSQDADAMAVGPDVGAVPAQEGALTDSLLDSPNNPAPPAAQADQNAPSAPGDNLRPFFVEVEVAPGQVQMLQLNAESPEHALQILRDYRGDPRVLRGPSPEPLP